MSRLFILAALLLAMVCMNAQAADGCVLDGTYVRADTVSSQNAQVLSITGGKAQVFEQALQVGNTDRIQHPVRLIGKRAAVVSFAVRAESPTSDGVRFFDLIDNVGHARYTGFDYDCKARQLFHPSIGDWTRI
jgi:hypothetical protein